MRSNHPYYGPPPRRGIPWWTPLLALVALIGAVAGGIATTHDGASTAAAEPAPRTGGVLGTRATVTSAKPAATAATTAAQPTSTATASTTISAADATLVARGRPLLGAPLADLAGAGVHARRARVLAVVGPKIFWLGTGGSRRVLVHLQGNGTRWAIRAAQRLTFVGVVARNRPGAAEAWGLSRREGFGLLARQGFHVEVYGPRIDFDCVRGCS